MEFAKFPLESAPTENPKHLGGKISSDFSLSLSLSLEGFSQLLQASAFRVSDFMCSVIHPHNSNGMNQLNISL